jgi:hypothetical protein
MPHELEDDDRLLAVNILAYPKLFPPEIVDLARLHASSAHDQ